MQRLNRAPARHYTPIEGIEPGVLAVPGTPAALAEFPIPNPGSLIP